MNDLPTVLQVLAILAAVGGLSWWLSRSAEGASKRADEAARASNQARWDRELAERREFEKSATIMRARVLSSSHGGSMRNLKPVLLMRLKVEAPDGAYEVDVERVVEYDELRFFREDRTIDVYVDPKNREHVVPCDPGTAKLLRDADGLGD